MISNNIPKTTKLTLKKIVENIDKMTLEKGFGTETPPLTTEQKKKLMDMTSMFENYGECLNHEEAIINSAKGLTELCELAETYAITECGDWFQKEIVNKDMQSLKKRVVEYGKLAKETYSRMQQLGVAYQDVGHVLNRYFDIKKRNPESAVNNTTNVLVKQ
jgi:hypothetical protein